MVIPKNTAKPFFSRGSIFRGRQPYKIHGRYRIHFSRLVPPPTILIFFAIFFAGLQKSAKIVKIDPREKKGLFYSNYIVISTTSLGLNNQKIE